ncbi:MAG: hypothetical protein HZB38_19000, partial [Planctomycetes bacterium]|nr:hypothetical protein [Planctomycetota bacterium]
MRRTFAHLLLGLPTLGAACLVSSAWGQIPTYAVEYFGQPPGANNIGSVTGVNEHGQFVVNHYVGSGTRSWVLTPGAGFAQLPLPAGYAYSLAADIDNSGVVVGAVTPTSGRGIAAVWTPGPTGYTVQTRLGLPGHLYSSMLASNNRGDAVGLSYATSTSTAVPVWFQSDGTVVSLTTLGWPATLATVSDINEQRVVCGGQYRLNLETQVLTDLGLPETPPGGTRYVSVSGLAINEAGQVAAIGALATSSGAWTILRYSDDFGWQQVSIWALTYGGPFDIDNAGNVLMDTSSGSARELLIYSDSAGGLYRPGDYREYEAFYWLPMRYSARMNYHGQIACYLLNTNNSDQRFGWGLLTPTGTNILAGDVNADGHVRLDDLCAFASNPIDMNGDG